jgi:hypothetical protein
MRVPFTFFFPVPPLAWLAAIGLVHCSPAGAGDPPGPSGSGSGGSGAAGQAGASSAGAGGAGGQNVASGGENGATGGQGGSGTPSGTGGQVTGTGGDVTGGTGGTVGEFDAGSDPLRNRVQPGQVCERLATVQCAAEAWCCNNPGRSVEQCKVAQREACANLYLDAVSLDSISGYSVDAAEVAFTEFESLASQCDPDIAAWGITPSGLRGITLGTVAADQECTPADASNIPKMAAHLASCLNAATHACLPTGLTGVPPLASWLCAARGGSGAACFSDFNCVDGLYCNNDVDSPRLVGSQCFSRKADGAGCTFPNECQSLTCKGGLCVEATSQTAYCLAQ